jgi:hypothetical protein
MEQATHESGTPKTDETVDAPVKTWVVWEPAIRGGLNAGWVLAGLNVVNWLFGLYGGGAFGEGQGPIGAFSSIRDLAFSATCILFLGRLVLFYLVGYRVAQRTGQALSGAVAGLLTGVVDGVSGLVVILLGIVFFPVYTLSNGFAGAAHPVGDALVAGMWEVLALAVAGVLLGGIGGASLESARIPGAA